MQNNEKVSPEESEERNQQLFSDLHKIYGSGIVNETAQHLNLVRKRLLQNADAVTQQDGTNHQPAVLNGQQERYTSMSTDSTHSASFRERSKYHYLSTIAAILFVSLLVGSLVVVFTLSHQSRTGSSVSTSTHTTGGGVWNITGSMHVARSGDTATLLPNGKVLVVGGFNAITSAELYNPATGKWSLTGSLHNGRDFGTATLLPDGEVLVAGGGTSNHNIPATASAEVYNPATGKWNITGTMHIARVGQTAVLLTDGKVLVIGGESNSDAHLASAELYDPASRKWSLTGSMHEGRFDPTATLLQNGKVLVAGGETSTGQTNSAELYNPTTGVWSYTGRMHTGHFLDTTTLLSDGRVLVAGGIESRSILNSAELYNPSNGTWSLTGRMHIGRYSGAATLLSDGRVLIVGGYTLSSHPPILSDLASAELYDPSTGMWSTAGTMRTAREIATATLLPDGKILVAGGTLNNHDLSSAELYTPAHN